MTREEAEIGFDTQGNGYNGLDNIWKSIPEQNWYTKSYDYWEQSETTVDGVLGGYGFISPVDVSTSRSLISKYYVGDSISRKTIRALDCGAGIGRVSKSVLIPSFELVDAIEQSPSHCRAMREQLPELNRIFECGLQNMPTLPYKFDCIWAQWVLLYLRDDALDRFLRGCVEALSDGGLLFVKENVSRTGFFFDDEDNSVTRSLEQLKNALLNAGLKVIECTEQRKFPEELFPVWILVCKKAIL